MPARIVLIGPPGAGKTAVGRLLASALGSSLRDTDADVEESMGLSVADIFVQYGEPEFRDQEARAVIAAVSGHDGVVALGGGAPMTESTEQYLSAYARAGGTVVFLDVSVGVAVPRVGLDGARPLLLGNPRQQWSALMEKRRPVYETLATVSVLTDGLTPEDVAERLLKEVQ